MNFKLKTITLGLLMAAVATQPLQGMQKDQKKYDVGSDYFKEDDDLADDILEVLNTGEALVLAAKNVDGRFKKLIDEGALINYQDVYDNTALHWATNWDRLEMVKYLIEHGAVIDLADTHGWTAFHWAALLNHTETAKYLVEHGAAINLADKYGKTALYLAAERNHLKMVKYLIENGADFNKSDQLGLTAFDTARRYDKNDIAAYLQNCLDFYFNNGIVAPGQDPNLLPGDDARAAIAIRKQDMDAMRTIIPTIPNFNFDHFIKLTERENLLESKHELCHLKVKLTGKEHDSQSGREAGRQQGMLQLLKRQHDTKFNYTHLQ